MKNNKLYNQPIQKMPHLPPAIQALVSKLLSCIDNYDSFTFKNIIMENQLPLQSKNLLLNKSLLLYLSVPPQISSLPIKQIISLLLSFQANPNLRLRFPDNGYQVTQNNNNNYALFSLVEKNDVEMTQIFLDNGAEVNICDTTGKNCLFHMMKNYNCDLRPMCILLLNKGIKINSCDNNGFTPLMEIINKNFLYLIDIFLKYNVDVNVVNFKDGNTVMHYAVLNRNREAVWFLLSNAKPNISIKNKNGDTIVDLAKKGMSSKDICDLIIKYAANLAKVQEQMNQVKKEEEGVNDKKQEEGNSMTISQTDLNKLEKLKLTEEAENKEEKVNKEEVFIFPTNDVASRVEIPFSFQDYNPNNQQGNLGNEGENLQNNQSNQGGDEQHPSNQFHSFIKIQNTPTLFLDISDEVNQDKLICDGLKTENKSLTLTLNNCEENLKTLLIENEALKNELVSLKNENILQAQQMTMLNDKINKTDINYKKQLQAKTILMDNTDKAIKELCSKFEEIQQKKEVENKEIDSNLPSQPINPKDIPSGYELYLKQKFSNETLTDDYLINNLTEDIIDFKKLCKFSYDEKMEIINVIVSRFRELLPEAEFLLYGSYFTGLALDWSDVDILVIPKDDDSYSNQSNSNSSITSSSTTNKYKQLYGSLIVKLKNVNWVESVQVIDENMILTKIKVTVPGGNNKQMNFYLSIMNSYVEQNDTNFQKSSEIIVKYIKQYDKVMVPLTLALKQILFNSLLISNNNNLLNMKGGINSYALTVIIISFLISYKEQSFLTEKNLGRIFLEFLQKYANNFENNMNNKIIYIPETEMNNNKYNYYSSNINNGNCEMVVIDPCDWKNNLTDGMCRLQSIKLALMISLSVGKDLCECSCHYKNGADKSCLAISKKKHCILNKMFKSVKRLAIGEDSY